MDVCGSEGGYQKAALLAAERLGLREAPADIHRSAATLNPKIEVILWDKSLICARAIPAESTAVAAVDTRRRPNR